MVMSLLRPSFKQGFARSAEESKYPHLWRGLVGAWIPTLGVTGNTLHDVSAFKNHGALTGMDAGTDWVVSDGRYALDFDGVNDFIDIGITKIGDTSLFADSGQRWSVVVEVRIPPGASGTFLAKASANVIDRTFQLVQTTGNSMLVILRGVSTNTGVDIADGKKKFLVVTWDGVTARVFIEAGTPFVLDVGVAPEETSQRIIIGARTQGTGFLLTGQITMALIYNRALTPNEIAFMHRNPLAMFKQREVFQGIIFDRIYSLSNVAMTQSKLTSINITQSKLTNITLVK